MKVVLPARRSDGLEIVEGFNLMRLLREVERRDGLKDLSIIYRVRWCKSGGGFGDSCLVMTSGVS